MDKKEVVVTFSGGSARGTWAWGFAKALLDNNIKLKAVAGSSAGSCVSAMYAFGLIDKLYEKAMSYNDPKKFLFPTRNPISMLMNHSILSLDPLEKFLTENLTDDIYDNSMPVHISVVNVNTGKKEIISSKAHPKEYFIKAIIASMSMPYIFKSVKLGDDYYYDGGYVENIPVKCLNQYKADRHYIVNITSELKDSNIKPTWLNFPQTSIRMIEIMHREIMQNDIEKGTIKYWQYSDVYKVIRITPDDQFAKNMLDVSREAITNNMEYGYDTAIRLLKEDNLI